MDALMLSCWARLFHAVREDLRAQVDKLSCLQMRRAALRLQSANPLMNPSLDMVVDEALSYEGCASVAERRARLVGHHGGQR